MKTIQELEKMTDDELNEELGRILGWTYHDIEYAHVGGGAVFEQFWLPPGIDIKTLTAADISSGPNYGRSLPDFTSDLDAVAEVENKIIRTYGDIYTDHLKAERGIHWGFSTARQRTIALIATLQPQ